MYLLALQRFDPATSRHKSTTFRDHIYHKYKKTIKGNICIVFFTSSSTCVSKRWTSKHASLQLSLWGSAVVSAGYCEVLLTRSVTIGAYQQVSVSFKLSVEAFILPIAELHSNVSSFNVRQTPMPFSHFHSYELSEAFLQKIKSTSVQRELNSVFYTELHVLTYLRFRIGLQGILRKKYISSSIWLKTNCETEDVMR